MTGCTPKESAHCQWSRSDEESQDAEGQAAGSSVSAHPQLIGDGRRPAALVAEIQVDHDRRASCADRTVVLVRTSHGVVPIPARFQGVSQVLLAYCKLLWV